MGKLKRPLAFSGLSLFLALAAVYVFGVFCGVVVAILAGGAVIVQLYLKNKDGAQICGIALFCTVAAIALYTADSARTNAILDSYCGETATVTAVVTDWRDVDGVTLVTAKITHINGEDTPDFASSFFSEDAFDAGDEISAVVKFDDVRDPYKNELAIQCRIETMLGISKAKHKLILASYNARSYLEREIRYWLPGDEGSVVSTIMTGQISNIDPSMKLTFDRAGISHVLVVSGLHITLIISFVFTILIRVIKNKWIQAAILAAVIAACLLFYGAAASVARSCVMCAVVYLSRFTTRRYDPPTSLALAAIVILLPSPSTAVDVSFLLSFGCCVATSIIFPYVENAIDRKLSSQKFFIKLVRRILKELALTFTVNIVVFPIQILFGIPVSLVSPLVNIAVVLLIPVLMVSAFLMYIPIEFITALAGLVSGVCSKIIIAVSEFFASFALASVSVSAGYLKIWLAFCGVVVLVCALYKNEKVRARFVSACMVLVLLIGIMSRIAFTATKPTVTLYRDSAIIVQDNGRAFVIVDDINRKGVDYLMSYLSYRYIEEVAYVIITEDIGQTTELYIQEKMPDAIIAASYITNTPGIISYERVNYVQGMGRFDITVFYDKTIEILSDGATLFISERNPENTYSGYDVVALRYGSSYLDGYCVIGSRVYKADCSVVFYFNGNGTVKTVAE